VEILIENEFSFYFSKARVGLLLRPTINHIAALAMQILHAEMSGVVRTPFRFPQFFEAMIWLESFRYFGSKLLNPKRKADTVEDLKIQIGGRNIDGLTRESILVALGQRVVELKRLNAGSRSRLGFAPKNKESFFNGAWILGRIHGERLYQIYRKGGIQSQQIVDWLSMPIEGEEWASAYNDFVSKVESVSLRHIRKERL
jgi:hypothetical protein